jgi:hypothetical protein
VAPRHNVEELDIKSARTSERRREGEVFKIQDFKMLISTSRIDLFGAFNERERGCIGGS